MSKSICALVGRECPRTSDPTARIFCPHWKDAIPEHEKDGSGNIVAELIYTGCQLPKLIPYLISVTAAANHAQKAGEQSRNAVMHLTAREEALRDTLLPSLLGQIVSPALLGPAKNLDSNEE